MHPTPDDPRISTEPDGAPRRDPEPPVDPDAPGRGLDEVDDPIPEPNEPG